jgi:hypothetical protein
MLAPSTESCVVQCLVGRCLMLLPPSSTSHAGSMNTYTEQRDTPPYACTCSTPFVRFAFLFPYVSSCDTYQENTRLHRMATRLLSDSSRSSPRILDAVASNCANTTTPASGAAQNANEFVCQLSPTTSHQLRILTTILILVKNLVAVDARVDPPRPALVTIMLHLTSYPHRTDRTLHDAL